MVIEVTPSKFQQRFWTFRSGTEDYLPERHSLVVPYNAHFNRADVSDFIIKQYNYRSPKQMHKRARQRISSKWQSNHYQHIVREKLFFIESLHVPGYDPCGFDNVLQKDSNKRSKARSMKAHPLPYLESPFVPIFIGGTGRSGTTVLKRILGLHDSLATIEWESKFISTENGLMDLLYDFSENKLFVIEVIINARVIVELNVFPVCIKGCTELWR